MASANPKQMPFSAKHSQKSNPQGLSANLGTAGQIKSRSFKKAENDLDGSFEVDSDFQHIQAVKDKYQTLVKSCLEGKINIQNGSIVDKIVTDSQNFKENQKKLALEQLIKLNSFLTENQSLQFLADLKAEKYLYQLLTKLKQSFQGPLFQEMSSVCFRAWEQFLILQKEFVSESPFLPKFSLQYDLSQVGEEETSAPEVHLKQIPLKRLLDDASQNAEEMADWLINNPKVKMITLRKYPVDLPPFEFKRLVSEFVTALYEAVYLCVEGYFLHPDHKDGNFAKIYPHHSEESDKEDSDDTSSADNVLPSIHF